MRLRGFYGVVDAPASPAAARALAALLVEGGACAVQVRLKRATTRALLDAARAVAEVTRAAGVPLVVNDRLDVALVAFASAVHLGQDDLALADARAVIGDRPLRVGVSTHHVAQAAAAARAGADYLGFGPVFATSTKENPDPVQGLEALAAAVRAAAPVPIVAIGGVTPAHAAAIAATGAAAACAISSVNGAKDVVAAARELARAWG